MDLTDFGWIQGSSRHEVVARSKIEEEKEKRSTIKDTQSVQLHTGCISICDFLDYILVLLKACFSEILMCHFYMFCYVLQSFSMS